MNFGFCAKYSGSTCAKLLPLRVTVLSLSYKAANGWPDGSAIYTLTIKIENFTKDERGVLPVLRCANMVDDGHYYVGSADVQSLPAISQLTGDVFVGFPHKDSETPDVLPNNCREAVIWLEPGGAIQAKRGSLRTYETAYVRLPQGLLSSLTSEAVAGQAALATGS